MNPYFKSVFLILMFLIAGSGFLMIGLDIWNNPFTLEPNFNNDPVIDAINTLGILGSRLWGVCWIVTAFCSLAVIITLVRLLTKDFKYLDGVLE